MATVTAKDNFEAKEAAKKLKDAMKGIGTNEGAILEVLRSHNNHQRQAIKAAYKDSYKKELAADLKSELSGAFEYAVLASLLLPPVFDSQELRRAMKGSDDVGALIEIFCSRSDDELKKIKHAYAEEFKKNLEDDLKTEISGDIKYLILSLCNTKRDNGCSDDKAKKDAEDILEAGEKKLGADDGAFIPILCSRSFKQLKETFDEYERKSGKEIEKVIEAEIKGNMKKALFSIVKYVKFKEAFFAERLYQSMSGVGTDEKTLTRIIISRSEIDLKDIKGVYHTAYKKSLEESIQKDCGGDFKRYLFALVKS